MDVAAWDARYASAELVWSAGPNRFVEAAVRDQPPGRALDLACGEGRNALWLADRGWQVTAIDWSAVAVDKGRRRAREHPAGRRIDWQVGDALTAPLPTGLDLVVVAYFQASPAARRTAMRRAFASLRPGGQLLVVAHDSTNLTEGTGGPQDPGVLYTAEDALGDLDVEPFDVVRAERVTRVVAATDAHGSAGTAYDALVHVRRGGPGVSAP